MKYLDRKYEAGEDDQNPLSVILGWPTKLETSRKAAARVDLGPFIHRHTQQSLSYSLQYDRDGHLVTLAPTGSGKGVSVIIPNLLHYKGPTIVIDPKGENFSVTARYRKELGQRIFLLDPFESIDDEIIERHSLQRDSLNPLDLCLLKGSNVDNDAQMIANLLSDEGSAGDNPFWDITARKLLSGIIAHQMNVAQTSSESPSFSAVIDAMFSDDPVNSIAQMLYTQEPTKFVTSSVGSGFLSLKAEQTRDGILTTAQSYLTTVMSSKLSSHMDNSTIDLEDVQQSEDYTIYLVIPPNKLKSHSFLLKVWVGALMHAIMERKSLPKKRTLFILDECANLGELDILRKAVTLLRGYGLQVWMFFQDLSQMRMLYPDDFDTMINNCGVLQAFGLSRRSAAGPLASIVGRYTTKDITSLDRTQQLISMSPGKVRVARLAKYYKDKAFSGRFDENPLIRPPKARESRWPKNGFLSWRGSHTRFS